MSHTHEADLEVKGGRPRKVKKICTEDDCNDVVRSLGLCSKHYVRQWRGGTTTSQNRVAIKKDCDVKYCGRPHYSLGYCRNHYVHLKKHGDPILKNPRGPLWMTEQRRKLSETQQVPGFESPSRPKLDVQLAQERKTQCNHEGCDEQQYAKLLCPFHYARSWDRPHHTKVIGMNGHPKRADSHIKFNSRIPLPL